MAWISDPRLRIEQVTTSTGFDHTVGRVFYSYRLNYGPNDISQNLWHIVHVSLWERDGSQRDHIDTRYNGDGLSLRREHKHGGEGDDYIAHVDSRWMQPNGDSSTFVSDVREYPASELKEEQTAESYYLHLGAHPFSGSNVEEFSSEYQINF